MKLKVLFGIVLSIFSLTIVGCGGGGGGSLAPVSTTVSGEASKGPIIGGDVKIFAINADGSVQTEPLSTTPATVKTRAPFGNYSAVIGFAGPVKVVVSNGSYKDEATGTTVDFTGKTLSAIVANVAGSARVAVTPHTELAVRKAGSVLTPANIKKANENVASSAGLHEVDIITASPSTDPRYKFALAVISQAAGTGVNDLTNLLTTVANAIDIETGTINSPPVSSTLGSATAAAFNNPIIRPIGTVIPGILPDTVAEVNVSAPTLVQQINSQVAINTTIKRLDGAPSVNTTVEFLVTTGSGTFSAATSKTNASGVATVFLTSAAEETLVFTVHAHPFTSSSQVVFANLDRPATVTLKADQLQGITKFQGPVTLSAEVTRFGFGLGLGDKLVPDGTIVTFTSTGTGGALSSSTSLTIAGIATVKLNSSTAGNIDVTAKAGTITSSPPVTVQFIDQPVTATLKMISSGTFPAGITKITSLIGTVSIAPGGVSVKTVPNANSSTGISADTAMFSLSGVAPLNAALLPTEVTQVSSITPNKNVLVPLVSFTGGFDFGEFATIVTDITPGTFPTKNDFTVSGFKAIGVDASGAQVFIPNLLVDFTLSLQN